MALVLGLPVRETAGRGGDRAYRRTQYQGGTITQLLLILIEQERWTIAMKLSSFSRQARSPDFCA